MSNAAIPWMNAFWPTINDGTVFLPPKPAWKFIGVTLTEDPDNPGQNILQVTNGSSSITGDVNGTIGENYVSTISGPTPGSSTIGFPAGNILSMTGSDTNALIDTSVPGYICYGGANDGSGTDNLQLLATCDQVIFGTLKTGMAPVVTMLGQNWFFGTSFADTDQPLYLGIGANLSLLARAGTIATSLSIGWLNPHTSSHGYPSKYFGQDGFQTGNTNGGPVYFFGGAKHGTGLKKGVFFALNGDPTAAGETMLETGEVITGQRYIALCRGAVMTSTQMPANTGDLVVYVANAATAPTANAVGGGILYAQAGALKWRGSSGTITTMGTAEPHCDQCGSDFMTEHESEKYGYLAVCLKCMADELGARKWIKRSRTP